MDNLRGFLKITAFFVWCLIIVPPQLLVLLFTRDSENVYRIPKIFHSGVCFIFGIRVESTGTRIADDQTLFVCNHLSYLDIPALGSLIKGSFVAKEDVRHWPLFGFLARLQDTAFISRSRHTAGQSRHHLSKKIKDGRNLILFPEGTSTDGRDVMPFKSALFATIVEEEKDQARGERPLVIQPVTITIPVIDGRPSQSEYYERDVYAWHGTMTLTPHLWRFACAKGATVSIRFHKPRTARDYDDRKTIAHACHEDVKQGLLTETLETTKAA